MLETKCNGLQPNLEKLESTQVHTGVIHAALRTIAIVIGEGSSQGQGYGLISVVKQSKTSLQTKKMGGHTNDVQSYVIVYRFRGYICVTVVSAELFSTVVQRTWVPLRYKISPTVISLFRSFMGLNVPQRKLQYSGNHLLFLYSVIDGELHCFDLQINNICLH